MYKKITMNCTKLMLNFSFISTQPDRFFFLLLKLCISLHEGKLNFFSSFNIFGKESLDAIFHHDWKLQRNCFHIFKRIFWKRHICGVRYVLWWCWGWGTSWKKYCAIDLMFYHIQTSYVMQHMKGETLHASHLITMIMVNVSHVIFVMLFLGTRLHYLKIFWVFWIQFGCSMWVVNAECMNISK